eukprot:446383-Karenia_brevis.AAC.1
MTHEPSDAPAHLRTSCTSRQGRNISIMKTAYRPLSSALLLSSGFRGNLPYRIGTRHGLCVRKTR